MRRLSLLCIGIFILSGCSTYRFVESGEGYIVTRDKIAIPEYTAGKDNAAPALELAKERFKRRRDTVEDYYTRMGHMEGRFKEVFLDPPVMVAKLIGGFLVWPWTAFTDYKYEKDPAYRARVTAKEDAEDEAERKRVAELKAQLADYIRQDLSAEPQPAYAGTEPGARSVTVQQEIKASVQEPAGEVVVTPEVAALAEVAAPVVSASLNQEGPVAVASAHPSKGKSPLKVKFTGSKSYSRGARIMTYDWDFGDGERSTKANPANTYLSATYGSRKYTATLTVKDSLGRSSSASLDIEVVNR
jgi:hypothetical protein